jgi:prepilin-type N-terminal cleavage/methylation domain-containing protein
VNGVRSRRRGFTLVEVLTAMSITTVLIGAMYSLYSYSYRTFRVQEQTAEAQQNARAAIQLLSRDIIMAGYSTMHNGIIFANKSSLTIQSYETNISYSRYSSNRIGRTVGGTRQAVAEQVRRLSFTYKDGSGSTIHPDVSGNVPVGIVQLVLISVTAGTPAFGAYSASCTMETTLRPRNL